MVDVEGRAETGGWAPVPPGTALATRGPTTPGGNLLIAAGLGAGVLFVRGTARAMTFFWAVPATVLRRASEVPAIHRRLVDLEQVWAEARTQLVLESSQAADKLIPPIVHEVLQRVDLDAVVDRVDIDRVIDRVDMVTLARELINELDIPAIIRESSGAMAVETVDGLRIQGMKVDLWLAKTVDRLLGRSTRSPEPVLLDGSEEGAAALFPGR